MKSQNSQSGFILVSSAVSAVVLLGFLGLAVDVGFLQYQKRRIQSAADAAAQGAAIQLANGASSATAIAEGKYDSAKNGFSDGLNGVTISINIPPLSGNYKNTSEAAEAILKQSNSTYFIQFFNINSVTVAARAVAMAGNGPNCIYALDSTAQDALVASGGSTQVNAGCGIYVNSNNSKALEATGGACISAPIVNVVGSESGAQTPSCSGWPAPSVNQASVTDPLAYLTAPAAPTSCTQIGYTLNSGSATIGPGTYCNGITVNGTGVTLYLNTGLYILEGGGLQVQGGANIVSNSGGVTFDNTGGAKIGSTTYNYKNITVSGGSATALAAPAASSGGDMAGILFFDRTGGSNQKQAISGGSGATFTGALYFPYSEVDYTGGSAGTGDWTIIVADKLAFSGGSNFGRDFSNYPNGSPIKSGGLFVE